MRNKTLATLVVIGLAAPVWAQLATQPTDAPPPPVSQAEVDQAMKKMEQRKAERVAKGEDVTPADRPTTGPTAQDVQSMQEQLRGLQAQVRALRQQNNELLSQLVTLQPNRMELRQLQDEARLNLERDRLAAERQDAADQRERDRSYDNGSYNNGNNGANRDIVIVQPNPDQPRTGNSTPVQNPTPNKPPTPAPTPTVQGKQPDAPDLTGRVYHHSDTGSNTNSQAKEAPAPKQPPAQQDAPPQSNNNGSAPKSVTAGGNGNGAKTSNGAK